MQPWSRLGDIYMHTLWRPLWVINKCSWLKNDSLLGDSMWNILTCCVILRTKKNINWPYFILYLTQYNLMLVSQYLCWWMSLLTNLFSIIWMLVWLVGCGTFLWGKYAWLLLTGNLKNRLPILLSYLWIWRYSFYFILHERVDLVEFYSLVLT